MPGTMAAPAAWMVTMMRSALVRRAVASGVCGVAVCMTTATKPSASALRLALSAGVGTGGDAPSLREQTAGGAEIFPSPRRIPGASVMLRSATSARASHPMGRPGNTTSTSGQAIRPRTASSVARSRRGGTGTAKRPARSVPGPVTRQLTTMANWRRLVRTAVSQVTLCASPTSADPFHTVPET